MDKQTTTDFQNQEIDENEARLLQAMSIDDEKTVTPEYKAQAGKPLKSGQAPAKMFDIVEAAKTVCDPEIMINVYDLGLIYKIDQQENGNVYIEMTLTAPTCPVAGVLPQQLADAVSKVEGVGKVEVKVVWEPAWSLGRLSEEAKMMLEML